MPESIDGVGNVIRKTLLQKLQQILPNASTKSCIRFLEATLSFGAPPPSLALTLLDEKCTPSEIHLALIFCRNAVMALIDGTEAKLREENLKQVLMHHDRLLLFLIRNIEERYEQEEERLKAELLREGEAHLLSRARNEWANEKEIIIYNYFREFPVRSTATLLHVGEKQLTVRKEKDLINAFAASKKGDTAYTRLPGSELSVRLTVGEVTSKTVHLHCGKLTPIHKEKRRQPRVQSSELFKISVRDTRFRKWKGKIFDFSASGLGLVSDTETELLPGDAVAFSTRIHGYKLIGKGVVAWSKNYVGGCKMGISIEYDPESRMRLESEVRQREKQILGELKVHGPPTCFLSA